MEITAWGLYWMTKCDDIRTMLEIMVIVCVVSVIFFSMAVYDLGISKKWPITSAVLGFLFLIVATFMPRTKQIATIYIVPKIINSDIVQNDIPDEAKELYGLAKQWLTNKASKEGGK